ncbi:MAG: DEAD/DEAH box helicase [Gammaproteobacteria bacterium]|nr:DEAD/DEAH box helicase [Gammaproteobacteria bacterium]
MVFVLKRKPKLSPKHAAYPYQLDAVRAVEGLPYAAIFHEQGLGKTKIAIDLALLWLQNDTVDTVFIVTKKSLVENWRNEIAGHCHITPHILSANRAQNSASLNSPVLLYITNYETITANLQIIKLFLKTCRVGCILDESQKIKNPDAALTSTFHELAPSFKRRIIMTGTPAANRPYDIWAQFKFLDGGESLGESFDSFRQEMDLPSGRSNAFDYGNRLSSIYERIARFMVRETKDTAGIHLPEKTILSHQTELFPWQMAKYITFRDEIAYEYVRNGVVETDKIESILKRLLRLVQCASNPALIDGDYENDPAKFPRLLEMCREFTADSKVIIWTGFIDNVAWLANKLSGFDPVQIHGSLPIGQRNQAVRAFTHSSNKILIATPGAAKEGLTLTVANHAIFYDRGFSLDDYLQAQDRIHRISQTRDCFIHNLIATDTIDEWVDILLTAKYRAAQLAQGDIDTGAFRDLYRTDVHEVLQGVLLPDQSKKQQYS